MTEHFFCLHSGHLDSDRIAKVIEPLGAWHQNYTEPRGEKRGWFACRNRGNPHDGIVAREVMGAIEAAGGLDSFRVGFDPDAEDR